MQQFELNLLVFFFFRQRTVTRGVNKGVKEDFRSAMERQVARCEECLDQLLIQFLTQEREVLQLNYSNTTNYVA